MARESSLGGVRQRVNKCMNKLCDRDTEAMAAHELDSIARSLSPDSLTPFISAISDARPTDKTPLRRHSLRLLSLLSASHPEEAITPLVPRMLSSALRRLRDPDSSVRLACVDAVRSISSASSSETFASTILNPLFDALLHEQDQNAQLTAALSLASAIDAKSPHCSQLGAHLQKLVPKLVKLLKSNAFKAKPAMISLLGSVVAAGGADTSALTAVLLPVLVEALAWEDWAARKASSETLSVFAVAERDLLVGFKTSCVATFESRRFDKVKIVRDSMNRMLDLWREIPDVIDTDSIANKSQSKSSVRESISDNRSSSPVVPRKNRFNSSRSPPPEASPIITKNRKNTANIRNKKLSPPKTEQKTEASVLKTPLKVVNEERSFKSSARVVPVEEIEESEERENGEYKERENGDLSFIRMQLVQIENQQSSLHDLLQKFMGTSQNGINSLESRVHGLEMALDEISRNFSDQNENEANNTCCSFPGSEFLSPKYWRRNESRFPNPRLSLSEGRRHSFNQSGHGFMVNPLAQINPLIMRENIAAEIKETGRRA